jgi:hypothetical protein
MVKKFIFAGMEASGNLYSLAAYYIGKILYNLFRLHMTANKGNKKIHTFNCVEINSIRDV